LLLQTRCERRIAADALQICRHGASSLSTALLVPQYFPPSVSPRPLAYARFPPIILSLLQIVGVSADIKKGDVEKFIKDSKYFDCTFPLAFDPENGVRDSFKAMQGKNGVQTPCLFLFDGAGKCVWTERFSKAANWRSVPTPQQSAEQIRRFLAGEALIDNGETEIAAVDEEEAADLFASVAGDGEW
jgi:hypothetical protein